jgi:hypothetical protein
LSYEIPISPAPAAHLEARPWSRDWKPLRLWSHEKWWFNGGYNGWLPVVPHKAVAEVSE